MPSSCGSDKGSSPSLIPSLRSFRFQNKTAPYRPGRALERGSPVGSSLGKNSPNCSSGSGSIPQTPDSQKPGSSVSNVNSIGSGLEISSTTIPSKLSPSPSLELNSSSPKHTLLLNEKNSLSVESQFFIQRITSKIRQVISNDKNSSCSSSLKLSPEEIQRLRKELLQQYPNISAKWANQVTEDTKSTVNDSPDTEKILKINRKYLAELLRSFESPHEKSTSNVSESPVPPYEENNITRSLQTYSSSKFKNLIGSNIKQQTDIAVNSGTNTEPVADGNSDTDIRSEGQKQLAMDDYEVFCEKETNLRHMLDAFPGADIMEAQDILVRCKWDLKQAMEVAKQKPLKTTRKRMPSHGFSSQLPMPKRLSYQNEGTNDNFMQRLGPGTSQSALSKAAEEIVLDSSDEDTNDSTQIPGSTQSSNSSKFRSSQDANSKSITSTSKSATKRARRIITSESEDEDPLPPLKFTPKLPPKPPQNNMHSDKGISQVNDTKQNVIPQPNTNAKSSLVQNAKNSDSAPLLPVNKTQDTNSNKKEQPAKTENVPETNSAPSMNIDAIPNLPKGLVITQIQPTSNSQIESEKSTPALENSTTKSSNQLTGTIQGTSAISITPTNKSTNINLGSNLIMLKQSGNSMSITPANNSISITPSENSNVTKSSLKPNSSKSKLVKGKRKKYDSEEEDEEEYGNDDIYDSEESDFEENLTAAHSAVLSFFQDATNEELGTIPGCSKKKVEAIISVRPFKGWADLVEKLKNDKSLSPDLLNGAKKVIDMRNAISRLMAKCQQISLDMEDLVEDLKQNKESSTDYVSKQPDLLNDKMHLTSYQMLGLNWLLLMHNQEVNGILADEMGLGKTVQAVAFLAYLKEISISGPHLIVVPSSTLDNWKKELQVWWPSVSVICYHGPQDSRRELRLQILNDEVEEFDVMVTTYNMVTSSVEDRNFFKRLEFHYVVFDEAHMLKNMASQRYQNLMRVRAPRRLLLTGTPLQNNLVELMSLLIFAMPHMFSGKTEQIKQMFSCVCKSDEGKGAFERERIDHAKRIMKPFVLRRLKSEVLKELPAKHEETTLCLMSDDQAKKYEELVATFSDEVQNNKEKDISSSGAGMMMQLRRAANHPLLLRRHYDDDKLLKMSKSMLKEPSHSQADPNLIFEDMAVMSDFELHKLCKSYKVLKSLCLSDDVILNSGKFTVLDNLLPNLIKEGHRILLFSQFTMVLDIVQEYMNIKEYKYLRLDGQVPVAERQQLIDDFNSDPEIAVFLLSTRAGGLGINLTAADTVIIHDLDFNPYNDKQAEDRCHRVGQIRDVRVIRLVSEDTIEEGILQRAKEKLKLERDIHEENETEENDVASVAKLLRDALGLKTVKS